MFLEVQMWSDRFAAMAHSADAGLHLPLSFWREYYTLPFLTSVDITLLKT